MQKGLNDRLWNARIGLQLSRKYVASYLGIDESDVAAYECGDRRISYDELEKICFLYGLGIYDILRHREPEDPFEDLKRFRDELKIEKNKK